MSPAWLSAVSDAGQTLENPLVGIFCTEPPVWQAYSVASLGNNYHQSKIGSVTKEIADREVNFSVSYFFCDSHTNVLESPLSYRSHLSDSN